MTELQPITTEIRERQMDWPAIESLQRNALLMWMQLLVLRLHRADAHTIANAGENARGMV